MWMNNHTPNYKTKYDTLKYSFNKIKDLLENSRVNLHHSNIKGIKTLTEEDLDMLTAFIMCLYLTGGRISEVISIKLSDVIVDDNKEWLDIILPTKKSRSQDEPFRKIPTYIKDTDYDFAIKPLVFWYNHLINVVNNSNDLDENVLLFPISRQKGYLCCIACGFNPHWLRTIYLTQKASIYNLNIPKLKKLSGHKKYSSLVSYIELGIEDLKEDLKKIPNKN